jgi:hypothetical protein
MRKAPVLCSAPDAFKAHIFACFAGIMGVDMEIFDKSHGGLSPENILQGYGILLDSGILIKKICTKL